MSRYGTTERAARNPRAGAPSVPFTGITESLSTPGLAFQPGVSQAANELAQLNSVLGSLGETANAVTAYARQQEYAAEKAKAGQDEADRKARVLFEGQGLEQFYRDSPQTVADFRTGKISPEDFPNFIDRYVAEKTAGMHPIAQEAYKKAAYKQFDDEFARAKTILAAKSREEAFNLAANSIFANAGDGAKVDDNLASLAETVQNLTPAERNAVILKAAERIAEQGTNKKAMDSLLSRVQGSEINKSTIEARHAANAQKFDNLREKEISDAVLGMVADGRTTVARAFLARQRDAVGGATRLSLQNTINETESRGNAAAMRAYEVEQENAIKSQYNIQNTGKAAVGDLGSIQALRVEMPRADGTTNVVVVGQTQAVNDAMNTLFAQSDGKPFQPGQDYHPALTPANIAIASNAGYLPPAWDRDMSYGASAASDVTLLDAKAIPPQSLSRGFDTYRTLVNINSPMLNNVPDTARAFYNNALDLEQDPSYQTIAGTIDQRRVLLDAARMTQAKPPPLTPQDHAQLAETIKNTASSLAEPWFGSNAEFGASEVAYEIAAEAEKMRRLGYSGPVDKLASVAAKTVEARSIIVNNAIVNDPGDIPPKYRKSIGNMADQAIDEYMAKSGAASGVDRDSLRFFTSRTGGNAVWTLRDFLGHSIPGEKTTWTTQELVDQFNSPEKIAAASKAKNAKAKSGPSTGENPLDKIENIILDRGRTQ